MRRSSDASTTSTFSRPEFAEYRALLDANEASFLCGRFAPVVMVFIEDFMRASKSLDEYFPLMDGHPVDNFEDKPSQWLALHDSKFAAEQPWLKRFEENAFRHSAADETPHHSS